MSRRRASSSVIKADYPSARIDPWRPVLGKGQTRLAQGKCDGDRFRDDRIALYSCFRSNGIRRRRAADTQPHDVCDDLGFFAFTRFRSI